MTPQLVGSTSFYLIGNCCSRTRHGALGGGPKRWMKALVVRMILAIKDAATRGNDCLAIARPELVASGRYWSALASRRLAPAPRIKLAFRCLLALNPFPASVT